MSEPSDRSNLTLSLNSTMPQVRKLSRRPTVDDTDLPSVSSETAPCTPVELNEATVFQPEGHPKQSVIDGEIWPPIFKAEFVRSAKKIVPVDTDVFVCTYPKCGTTWIQHICTQLMNREPPQVGKELALVSPMIERMGGKYAEDIPTPRLLKTHFSYQNCPKSSTAKYIFCVRNPKDCLTSYFHHNRNFKIYDWENGDFDTFFELFASGGLAFGDYFDHLQGWLNHANDENVLFLTYEEMCADLETAVVQIGNFLGGQAAEIVNDPERLSQVVAESRIDSMKKDQGRWFPTSVLRQQNFIRKGGSRDWKNYFTREQSDRLDALFRTRMAGTIAENWWQSEMAWEDTPVPTPEITLTEAEEADREVDEITSISRRASVGNAAEMLTATGYAKSDRRGSVNSLASSASSGYASDGSGLSA